MPIENYDVVAMHYTLKDDEGNVIDSSSGEETLNFMMGNQDIIPGLEKHMSGKEVGDKFTATVAPAEAYGELIPELVQEVPLDAFDGIDDIQVGMQFHAETAQGPVPVTIIGLSESTATVDGNHPLAGKTLHFEVEIMEIGATKEGDSCTTDGCC